MKILNLIVFGLFLLVAIPATAQDSRPTCFEPLAQTFDEFNFTTKKNLFIRAEDFREKLKESEEAQGIIFVFRGRKTRLTEISELTDLIEKAMALGKNGYDSKIWIHDGGYRELAMVVFILKPLKCSDYSIPLPDFTAEKAEFAEYPSSNTVNVSRSELYSSLASRPEAECPPAARAVRACIGGTEVEVFVIVDTKGQVAYSKSMGGHPLLRASAEAFAKKWKFKEYKLSNKSLNFTGSIIIRFQEGPEISTHQ